MKGIAYLAVIVMLGLGVWYAMRPHGDVDQAAPAEKLPTSVEEFKQRPGGASTVDAGEFLISLAKEGKLPGFSKGEHGSMHVGNFDANPTSSSRTSAEKYPISRAIHLSKDGDTSDYFYVVKRESAGSGWNLQKAWRQDAEGRLMEDYPIP